MSAFASAIRAGANLRRAGITALIVGPILTLINQTAALAAFLDGKPFPAATAARIALTFVVPFVVSLTSSALADARRWRQ